jgi:hypothetical protein
MDEIQVKEKAEKLSQLHGCNVTPLVFKDGEDSIIGFVKEPPRIVKQRALDAVMQKGAVTAAGELMEAMLIKEESDQRLYVDRPEYDKFYLGASMACMELVKVSQEQFKKK